ncbi:hypothetical protein FXO38_09421 [Capsicum annuum]|nr:hypothetical protein FXO38_09421 [Capsicum annuum]
MLVSLRASTRVSSGFAPLRHSSPFSSHNRYSHNQTLRRRSRSVGGELLGGIPPISFLTPYGFTRPLTRTHVRLLGPFFKMGKMGNPQASIRSAQMSKNTGGACCRPQLRRQHSTSVLKAQALADPKSTLLLIPPDLGSWSEFLSAKGSWSPDARRALAATTKRIETQPPLAVTSINVDSHLGQPQARGSWEASILPTTIACPMINARFKGSDAIFIDAKAANRLRRCDPNISLDHSIGRSDGRQIAPHTKNGHAPPPTESRKSSQSVNLYYVWTCARGMTQPVQGRSASPTEGMR